MKVLLAFCFYLNLSLFAQQRVELLWNQHEFSLDSTYRLNDNTLIRIDQFKCYLQENSKGNNAQIHLIDAADSTSMRWATVHPSIQLGLTPLTQIKSSFKAELDPIHGMYWAWNTGYIALKCTGEVLDLSTKKTQPFEMHLGGYQQPFACVHQIPGKGKCLSIDLYQWFYAISPKTLTGLHVMLPSAESLHLFELIYPALNYDE